MALSNEDFKDVKRELGSKIAKKVSRVTHDGFDSHKRWGNSAIKGSGVNSPAMMEARKKHASDARNKAIAAKKEAPKKSYSFLTKNSFRIDAEGKSPKEAYKIARSKSRHYEKFHKASGSNGSSKLSGTYFKYSKEGLHANDGPYYQYRPSRFRKGNKY